jgi:adenylate cyclase
MRAQSNLDSLLGNWKNEELHDSVRLSSLNDYIWQGFLFANPDSAEVLARVMHDYATRAQIHKAISASKNTEGVSFAIRGRFDEALTCYNFALSYSDSVGDKKNYELTLNNVGILHSNRGEYVKALKSYLKVIEIKQELGAPEVDMRALYSNIGRLYADLGDWENNLKYRTKGLALCEEAGDLRGQGNAHHNLGTAHTGLGNDSLALLHLYKSIGFYKKANHLGGIGYTMNSLGEYFHGKGQLDSAEVYFERAIEIHSEYENLFALSFPLAHIGDIYLETERYDQAKESCQESYSLAKEIGILTTQHLACECLYNLNKQIGNDVLALEFHEEMLMLKDSIDSEEASKQLQLMEFRKEMVADSVKQAEEKLLLEQAHREDVEDTEQSRNFFVIAGLLALVAAIIIFVRYRKTHKAKTLVEAEKDQSENLLLNILPAEIAQELKETGEAKARNFDSVTVLFTDFKGFTEASEQLGAEALVAEINVCFKRFDEIVGDHGIEKIKTIGDAYMAAGGLPVPDDKAAVNTILAAMDMQAFMKERKLEQDSKGLAGFEMRVGVHTGPVVAGIVGIKKFQYDVWGDTVNTASRMESSGMINKVNISESTYEVVKDHPNFIFESRGMVTAKGKGEMNMYFVSTKV